MRTALRWLLVLPSFIAGGCVVMVVAAVVHLYALPDEGIIFGRWSSDWVYKPVLTFVSAGAGAWGAIMAGSAVSPSHNRETAFALAGLLTTVLILAFVAAILLGSEPRPAHEWFRAIIQMIVMPVAAFMTAASVEATKTTSGDRVEGGTGE